MAARITTIGEWECPPMAEALEIAGIWPLKVYIQQSQYTIEVQVS